MPTYSYRCDTCGHQFDATQRFADDPLTECPECGAAIRRVIQPVGVVFKGSGWYITDSRGPQKDGAEAKPAAAKDGGDTKESGGAKEPAAAAAKEPAAPAATKTEKPAAKAAAD